MNKEEMFRLQGMDPTKFKVTVSEKELGQQLGNAMSVNVIERVLVRALIAASLASSECLHDEWASGKRMKALSESRGQSLEAKKFRLNPPAASVYRTLIVDSGASKHFVNSAGLSSKEKAAIRSITPIPLQTANDVIWADQEIGRASCRERV